VYITFTCRNVALTLCTVDTLVSWEDGKAVRILQEGLNFSVGRTC
jgi:hypothetical protein